MKLKKVGIMWECFRGNIVYGEKQPEECKKCKKLDSFTKLPAEMVEERERDLMEEENEI